MSPDELALVNFAKKCGFEFLETDGDQIMKVQENGVVKNYKLLEVFAFNSTR